jgi:O-acetyl-ADP-ribose deacetylase (regulator of RNase III)
MDRRLTVLRSDITRLDVEAIVDAANSTLLGGGGVDGAIHRAAGPQLRAYCATLGGCPTGEARVTPGFKLPARWVIHAVGPVWHGGDRGEPELLAACYRHAFRLAAEKGVKTIAFPAISCGAYGYPWDQAAAIAVRECRAALEHNPELEQVLLVAFDGEMERVLKDALEY